MENRRLLYDNNNENDKSYNNWIRSIKLNIIENHIRLHYTPKRNVVQYNSYIRIYIYIYIILFFDLFQK